MNKTKKLAFAAVSVVMAGTMALSLAACAPSTNDDGSNNGGKPVTDIYDIKDEYGVLNEDGTLNYDAYERASGVTLNLGIGHNSITTSTAFGSTLGAQITLPDGNQYEAGDMKPAWVQMGADLNISWNDVYAGQQTSKNLEYILTNQDEQGTIYDHTDIFTSDLSEVVSYAASGTSILNLADYLDYMPNFKIFLLENPVVYLSLLQTGMSTTNGSGQKLYVAPYFDGNDDIERYCLIRQDWADMLLNGDTATTGSTAWGKSTSVTSYMQQTGKLTVDAVSPEGEHTATIKVVKNYDNVVTQLKASGSALATAYNDIAGEAYTGTSGNIIDVMNAALAKNSNANGTQLVNLYRAYIDACYQNEDGTQHYSAANRSDLFNGYDACWDVDDLVAILRCVMTNASALGGNVGGIMPRSSANDRTPDMVRLAAQLYGVRGADSRNEYTYIDAQGNLKDARASQDIYNAMANFNKLYQEGLIADYSSAGSFSGSCGTAGDNDYFMMYDYVQTQTLNGFYAEDATITGVTVDDGYTFAPIITPLAKWDVDGDGNHTDIMRFTESWRSVKTSGIALNGSLANAGNEEKLKAALQFVDYLYSDDGQIVSTFGPMATNAEGDGGFWYNEEATDAQVSAGQYFTYKGVKYSGSYYKGTYTPTITDKLYDSFKGKTVDGWSVTSNSTISNSKLNFTNYARQLIGSTLPVGVKSQSFEYQLTSKMGQQGADVVGQAITLGVIKGLSLEIDPDNYWYTCVPTSLPVSSRYQTDVLDSSTQINFKYLTGTQKDNKNFFSIFNWIILHGTNTTYNQQDVSVTFTSVANLMEQKLGTYSIQELATSRETALENGWSTAQSYWTFISSQTKENA